MSLWREFVTAHRDFFRLSRQWLGGDYYTLRRRLEMPRAWCRFMFSTFQHRYRLQRIRAKQQRETMAS